MVAAVNLQQHPFLRVAFAPSPMHAPFVRSWRSQPRLLHDPSHRGARERDALPFLQQIAQMLLARALILRLCQVHHLGSHCFTDTMSGLATSVAMGENGGPLLFIGRPGSPDMSPANA